MAGDANADLQVMASKLLHVPAKSDATPSC